MGGASTAPATRGKLGGTKNKIIIYAISPENLLKVLHREREPSLNRRHKSRWTPHHQVLRRLLFHARWI